MTQHLVKARLSRRDQGATAVEYGLMIALIAIIILTSVALLGGNLSGVFDQTAQRV